MNFYFFRIMGIPIEVSATSDFVWQYFTICSDDENSPSRSKAICKECNVIIKRGNDPKKYSIHPLKRHLRAKHEVIWGELEDYLVKRNITPSASDSKNFEDVNPILNIQNMKCEPPISEATQIRATSDFVWQYFTICPNEENPSDMSKASCAECNAIISRGQDPKKYSNFSLKRHLKLKHPNIWNELENYSVQQIGYFTSSDTKKLDDYLMPDIEMKHEPIEHPAVFKRNFAENSLSNETTSNPWTLVSQLEEFLYFCCPECNEKYQSKELFIKHALDCHPNSKESILKFNVKQEMYASDEDVYNQNYADIHFGSEDFSSEHISYIAEDYEDPCEDLDKGELVSSLKNPSDLSDLDLVPKKVSATTEFVWQYFTLCQNEELGIHGIYTKAECTECNVTISRGKDQKNYSVYPLKRHLRTKHPEIWSKLDNFLLQRISHITPEASSSKHPDDVGAAPIPDYKNMKHEPTEFIEVKATSDFVWKYFTICRDEENPTDLSRALCTLCDNTFSRGRDPKKLSNYSLKRHLKSQHADIWSELEKFLVEQIGYFTASNTRNLEEDCDDNNDDGHVKSELNENSYQNSSSIGKQPVIVSREVFREPIDPVEVSATSDFVWDHFTVCPSDVTRASCKECGVNISQGADPKKLSSYSLKRHLRIKHPNAWSKLENYLVQRIGHFTPSNTRVFKKKPKKIKERKFCEFCGKTFKIQCLLKEHIMVVHEKSKEYKCFQCNSVFRSGGNLTKHVRNVHEGIKNHCCDLCGKAYYKRTDLKRHKSSFHEGIKDQICDNCGKGFAISTNLKMHILAVHDGVKNHKCHVCGKDFFHASQMRKHIRNVHEGIRSKVCTLCGKAFKEGNHLKNHMMGVHQGLKLKKANKKTENTIQPPMMKD